MRALLALSVFAVAFASPAPLPAQEVAIRPDVPSLTAKTARWSRNENVFEDEKGAQITETVRVQGVDIEVYFTSRPQRAYELQAFFFARNEDTGQPFIYDAESRRTQAQVHREVIRAQPLLGTVKRSERSDLFGIMDDGRTFIGEVRKNSSEGGAKIFGWVVRVISAGKVVRIESNQTGLRRLAEKDPELLDNALIELETAAASEN